ncbi:MAG: hypothetical protein ACKVOE_05230 [Rickettsiales bacterium]
MTRLFSNNDTARPKPKTGERFLMREPEFPRRRDSRCQWEAEQKYHSLRRRLYRLKDAIELAGGEVTMLPSRDGVRPGAMYVRDPVASIAQADGSMSTWAPHVLPVFGDRKHAKIAQAELMQGEKVMLPGRFEGGNLIPDRSRNLVFWGVNNHDYVVQFKARNNHRWRRETPEDHVRRLAMAKPYAQALGAARAHHQAADADAAVQPPRVVALYIPNEHADSYYHLDGVMNVLPTGQAMLLPGILSKPAMYLLDKHIPAGDRIALQGEDLHRNATNFITVGSTVITPYASDKLKKTLGKLGYGVIDPSAMGLEIGDWDFSFRAGPRCVTQKITPDYGFPEPKKSHPVARAAFR